MVVSGNAWATNNSQTALIIAAEFREALKCFIALFRTVNFYQEVFALDWSRTLIQIFTQCSGS